MSNQNEIYGSDIMKLWIDDYIALKKSNAFHHCKAQELSLENLPFSKMQRALPILLNILLNTKNYL